MFCLKFSTFLQWAVEQALISTAMTHYLDEFCGGKGGSTHCQRVMCKFEQICQPLGISVADEKTVGAFSILIFLGIKFSTIERVVILPDDKLGVLKMKR